MPSTPGGVAAVRSAASGAARIRRLRLPGVKIVLTRRCLPSSAVIVMGAPVEGMTDPPVSRVDRNGRGFRIIRHPMAQAAAREFCSGFEEGTLRFFDAVLPRCARMVDFGAYIGFTALYAASWGAEVFAFEPSPTNHELLARNVAENPDLATRIRLFRHGVGDRDDSFPLYQAAEKVQQLRNE